MLKDQSERFFKTRFKFFFNFFIVTISLLLFFKLGNWGVIETSEARYAEISREMFLSRDFIHPRMLGILHYHKPPFIYWITSLSYSIFGTTEFAARFFLQIAYLLQLYIVYKIARLLFADEETSLFAVVIYATMPMVLISIRGLTTDAYVNTIILCSVYTWLRFITTKKPIHIYATSLLLGIGFLTKGPVPWIYTGLIILGTIDLTPAFKKYWLHYVVAIIILIPLSLSWYLVIINENTRLSDYFLIHHTVERFTNASSFKRAEPWWYYLATLPAIMFTWLLIFVAGFIKSKIISMPVLIKRIVLFWIVIPFIFFSAASSKLVLYILPMFGGVSVFCAYLLKKENLTKGIERTFVIILILLNLIFALTPAYRKEIFVPVWASFIPLLSLVLLIIINQSATMFSTAQRICLYAMTFTLSLVPFSTIFMSYNEMTVNAINPVAAWIKENKLDNRSVLVYNELMPSLAFHLNNDSIISLYDGNQSAERETQFEKNENWRRKWIDLTKDSVTRVPAKNSILIAKKGKINEHSQWLLAGYTQQKSFGKWVIYY